MGVGWPLDGFNEAKKSGVEEAYGEATQVCIEQPKRGQVHVCLLACLAAGTAHDPLDNRIEPLLIGGQKGTKGDGGN